MKFKNLKKMKLKLQQIFKNHILHLCIDQKVHIKILKIVKETFLQVEIKYLQPQDFQVN
jgi:hypothetical protein